MIKQHSPQRLDEFNRAFEVFKTKPGFVARKLPGKIFDTKRLKEIRELIKNLKPKTLETSELLIFGRQFVQNHSYFTKLQKEYCDLVSDWVGVKLEPLYNFLSLYNNLGVCKAHLDSPEAMYTLDVCIEQSEPWPIYFSQIREWPEFGQYVGANWHEDVINDPANDFSALTLEEGEGLIFSGTNQWHYRDRISTTHKNNFCHLILFHFIPEGTEELMLPENWAKIFNMPFLEQKTQNK